jgi:hypothetical protein
VSNLHDEFTELQRAELEERTAELMRETGMSHEHARFQAAIELGLSKGDVIYEDEAS